MFDFEYVDKTKFSERDKYPVAVMFMNKNPDLMVRLRHVKSK